LKAARRPEWLPAQRRVNTGGIEASARHSAKSPSPASVSSSTAPPPPVFCDAVTVSVTVVVGEVPAAFVQYNVYVNVPNVTGVTEFWPEGPRTPVQPEETAFVLPLAVQELALTELQLMVVVVSAGTEEAPSVSVGAAGFTVCGVAVKVTLAGADEPPRLLQVSV
jgi:hypothetical protein